MPQGVEELVSARNDISPVPTSVVMLTNLITSSDIELMADPRYFNEIKKEVGDECSKYGLVDNILIESNMEGNIWVKYASVKEAKQANEKLNNKNFNGRQILSSYGKEDAYVRRLYPQ